MNNATPRSDTPTLIAAMWILSRDIQSEDGVANAAIAEAAMRLEELHEAPPPKRMVTNEVENDWLVWCAVRYCLPRSSYIVGTCCEWLKANWDKLPENTRRLIQKDVERELADNTRMWEMDRHEWEGVAALWREENKDPAQ